MTQHDRILHVSLDFLKVKEKYEGIVPQPDEKQDKIFDESIKINGIREPLKINKDQIILDGHRRYRKAQKYKIDNIPVIFETFNSDLEEYAYVIEANLERRNLNDAQRVKLAIPLREIEKELAKQRQGKKTSSSIEPKGPSRDIVAKKTGVSSTKIYKVEKVLESGSKTIIENMLSNKTSIDRSFNLATQSKRKFEKVLMPTKKSNIVLADLPLKWSHEERGSATEHYETMPPAQYLLKNHVDDMPFANNCILFIWSWSGMKKDIEDIIEAWGFDIRGECIWIKTNKDGGTGGGSEHAEYNNLAFGMGSVFRSCHETLLYCTKGNVSLPNPENRVRSAFLSPKLEHSEKPPEVYEIIDTMYPEDEKLELYHRGKQKPRKNWSYHGNESGKLAI